MTHHANRHSKIKSPSPSPGSPHRMNINQSTKTRPQPTRSSIPECTTSGEHNSSHDDLPHPNLALYSIPTEQPPARACSNQPVNLHADFQSAPAPVPPGVRSVPVGRYSQPPLPPCSVSDLQPRTLPPCQCQLRGMQHQAMAYEVKSRVAPLRVITDNVMRLLSPKSNRQPETEKFEQMAISPIENLNVGCQAVSTPSPLSRHSQTSNDVSPEVQHILRHQDQQLKTLQQQIQKLLASQKLPRFAPLLNVQTQTAPTKKSAEVNTGYSLLECMPEMGGNESQDTEPDSSQSQSLIQHDLTHLDLPTQVTARSFSSDINVDYGSYDGSPTGSPKHEDGSSQSDTSWQSPVLGESVSMLAESAHQQQSTNLQLDMVVKNVRDLLSKHAPSNAERPLNTSVKVIEDIMAGQQDESCYNDSACSEEQADLEGDEPLAATHDSLAVEIYANAEDVALATKNQLKLLGIDLMSSPQPTNSRSACLPRVQYISMMLSDSMLSDSANKSVELNALALKYLQDEQLAHLAQITVHKTKQKNQTSLLRQVLTLNKSDPHATVADERFDGANNMSMASQEYLQRYALTGAATLTSPQGEKPTGLKSISEHTTEQTAATEDNTMLQVLDITRLKELPKLL